MKIDDQLMISRHGHQVMIEASGVYEKHLNVLLDALVVYAQRNEKYQDNWRRMGWRGQLIRIRERAERLWDHIWDWNREEQPSIDDALDLINFAAFLVRAVRDGEASHGGEWWTSD